jgi:alanine dehydrogenase
MPGAVPRTSTFALNNATLPYVLALAGDGLDALRADPGFLAGLNVYEGHLTEAAVADALGLAYLDPAVALGARQLAG